MCTHENYILAVARAAIDHLAATDADAADSLKRVKIVYGTGETGLRGVTYYGRWIGDGDARELIEVCAFGESDPVQLAGTTIHELAHVLAGCNAGHGKAWRIACERLGLRRVRAAGTQYVPAMFAPSLRQTLYNLPLPSDGSPGAHPVTRFAATRPASGPVRPCSAGNGTRGGQSRGKGSGSRMIKLTCERCGMIIRTTRRWLDNSGPPHCGCGGQFCDH